LLRRRVVGEVRNKRTGGNLPSKQRFQKYCGALDSARQITSYKARRCSRSRSATRLTVFLPRSASTRCSRRPIRRVSAAQVSPSNPARAPPGHASARSDADRDGKLRPCAALAHQSAECAVLLGSSGTGSVRVAGKPSSLEAASSRTRARLAAGGTRAPRSPSLRAPIPSLSALGPTQRRNL
jgi:hypothetical protein